MVSKAVETTVGLRRERRAAISHDQVVKLAQTKNKRECPAGNTHKQGSGTGTPPGVPGSFLFGLLPPFTEAQAEVQQAGLSSGAPPAGLTWPAASAQQCNQKSGNGVLFWAGGSLLSCYEQLLLGRPLSGQPPPQYLGGAGEARGCPSGKNRNAVAGKEGGCQALQVDGGWGW